VCFPGNEGGGVRHDSQEWIVARCRASLAHHLYLFDHAHVFVVEGVAVPSEFATDVGKASED
jgi:hypothetical protein